MTSKHTKLYVIIGIVLLIIIGILYYVSSLSKDTVTPDEQIPTVPTNLDISLIDTSWTWTQTIADTEVTDDMVLAPENKFVLTFGADGRFNSTTDCNGIGGEYTLDGEVLSLGSMMSTLMFCENSLESVYSLELGRVASYTITGNELRLNLARDTGTMIFQNKG